MIFEIIENDLYDAELQRKAAKEEKASCACGRKVCCGKHKNGQCACHKGKERG